MNLFSTYFNTLYQTHSPPRKHPEQAERITNFLDALKNNKLINTYPVQAIHQPFSNKAILSKIHSPSLLNFLSKTCQSLTQTNDNYFKIDKDTWLSSNSYEVALNALSTVAVACDDLISEAIRFSFCATRPPGHHATHQQPMGFCLLNTASFAAEYLLDHPRVNRIAILDFDAHHCNGTIDILQNRSDILICSIFEENGYPHQQFNATNLIETPIHHNTSNTEFYDLLTEWVPKIQAFQPDFLVISAGFDGHLKDPMSQLKLTNQTYYQIGTLVKHLSEVIPSLSICSILEGGYHLKELPFSILAYIEGMLH